MSRANRKKLTEAIKEEVERRELSTEVEWTMQSLEFLRNYAGEHPILRSLARQAKDPRWVPNERQVVQVHRLAHRERIDTTRHKVDALGKRLRKREGPDIPDSLQEPDWL